MLKKIIVVCLSVFLVSCNTSEKENILKNQFVNEVRNERESFFSEDSLSAAENLAFLGGELTSDLEYKYVNHYRLDRSYFSAFNNQDSIPPSVLR